MIKKLGLHHGAITLAISWAAYMINPLDGLLVTAMFFGGYTFKEYNEAQWRGFKLMDKSTWKDKFQWMDFITPWIVCAFNFRIM